MDVRIRTAVPDDETRIRELFLEMLHAVFPGQEAKGYEEGCLDRFWAGQEDRIYVAEDDGVVAFLSVEVHDDPVRFVYLDDCRIQKQRYRHGAYPQSGSLCGGDGSFSRAASCGEDEHTGDALL